MKKKFFFFFQIRIQNDNKDKTKQKQNIKSHKIRKKIFTDDLIKIELNIK